MLGRFLSGRVFGQLMSALGVRTARSERRAGMTGLLKPDVRFPDADDGAAMIHGHYFTTGGAPSVTRSTKHGVCTEPRTVTGVCSPGTL